MVKAEVIIDKDLCYGCGHCVKFCARGCIEITGDKFTSEGHLLPTVIKLEECTACGICGLMCPAIAIEVYKYEPKLVE